MISLKNACNKCGCSQLFIEIQGTRRGLYCSSCGQWQKWITKEELQVAKAKGLLILDLNRNIDNTVNNQIKILELEAVSGLHIEQLVDMFKNGYKLEKGVKNESNDKSTYEK